MVPEGACESQASTERLQRLCDELLALVARFQGEVPAGTRNETPEPIYPIRTVAHLTGVNPRRIRAWEDQYNLLSPARTGGGHRLYRETDIERIRWIKTMIDRGASLRGVQRSTASLVTPESVAVLPGEHA